MIAAERIVFLTTPAGLSIGAWINEDTGLPVVSINTEGLTSPYTYDDHTGLQGDADPYVVSKMDHNHYDVCMVTDGKTLASFYGIDAEANAGDHAAVLNGRWSDQCGLPKMEVMLNDMTLYDDEGTGDVGMAGRVVRGDEDNDTVVFITEGEALEYAQSLEPEDARFAGDHPEIERCKIIRSAAKYTESLEA